MIRKYSFRRSTLYIDEGFESKLFQYMFRITNRPRDEDVVKIAEIALLDI